MNIFNGIFFYFGHHKPGSGFEFSKKSLDPVPGTSIQLIRICYSVFSLREKKEASVERIPGLLLQVLLFSPEQPRLNEEKLLNIIKTAFLTYIQMNK